MAGGSGCAGVKVMVISGLVESAGPSVDRKGSDGANLALVVVEC